MERARFFSTAPPLNWQSGDSQLQPAPAPEMNSLPSGDCVHNLNWDQPTNHNALFQSALSSLVSSPSSNPPPTTASDSAAIHELICRLGGICNSDETPQASCYQSANTSCYSTPLNSPPKLNLSTMELHQQSRGGLPASRMPTVHLAPLAAEPGFAERAVRFSCFGGRSYGKLTGQFRLPETGKLTRVSSSHSLMGSGSPIGVSENGKEIAMLEGAQAEMEMRPKVGSRMSASSTPDNGEFGSAQEESSASDRITAGMEGSLRGNNENNARKRKAAPKGKVKEAPLSSFGANPPKTAEEDASNSKRSKLAETNGTDKDVAVKPKAEQNGGASSDAGQKQGKENNAKPPDPPKDYIHVRARRGQATDSHSLAERVRREKISERMKFLQDLVPGCNKVTGKAVMLDEIINYVQSLQRQVEFLSMKLATVNPRLDFNMENLLMKDMHQARGPMPTAVYHPLEAMSTSFSYPHRPQGTPLPSVGTNGLENQCSSNPLDSSLRRSLNMQLPPLDGFGDAPSQLGTLWEDDLHSVVQMGFGQSQESVFSSQGFHGTIPTDHMKIEL